MKAKIVLLAASSLLFLMHCKRTPTPGPIDNTGPVRYSPEIENIMYNNCTTCHGGNAPSAQIDLTTYDNVRTQTENGNLLSRINDGADPMPPSGQLSLENRDKIMKWMEEGFPEN